MNSNLHYASGKISLIGDRRNNQDRCALLKSGELLLLVLADGMGGHPRGEMAAQILVDTSNRLLQGVPKPIHDPRAFLSRILHEAHEEIQVFGLAQEPAIDPRTTAVVAMIQNGTAFWAHAGDSRFYLLRNGEVLARTTDHSYVERLHQQGIISEYQRQAHPQRNYVTRCLGGAGSLPDIEISTRRLQAGDTLMLCSDGLWSAIEEDLLGDALCGAMPLPEAVQALAEEATQASFPESDNTTLLALRLEHPAEPHEARGTAAPSAKNPDELDLAIQELQHAIDSFHNEQK